MTAPTHIRAWVALDSLGNIDLQTIREKEVHCKAVISRNPHFYTGPIGVTIVLGHELADQLENQNE